MENETESTTKRIPPGATRILPPAVAPRPKQSKVYIHIICMLQYKRIITQSH